VSTKGDTGNKTAFYAQLIISMRPI